MVGDDGKLKDSEYEEIKDTVQSIRLGVLRSAQYKRSQTRADYAISYHDVTTQYGLIDNFVSDDHNHVAVQVSKLIEARNLPFPYIPYIKKFRLRYMCCL